MTRSSPPGEPLIPGREAAVFFGCPVECVDNTLLVAFLFNHRPDWLRGVPRLIDLPRYNTQTQGHSFTRRRHLRGPAHG